MINTCSSNIRNLFYNNNIFYILFYINPIESVHKIRKKNKNKKKTAFSNINNYNIIGLFFT